MRLPCVVFAVFQVASALAAGDALEVLFADAGDGFAVTGIVNRIAGETRFVTADGTAADFWELEFRTADGGSNAVFRVDNRMPARSRTERRQGTVRSFFWNGMDLPGEMGALDVRADLTSGSSGMAVRWELSVRNRSRRWALSVTRYPCLRKVLAAGAGDALVPTKNLGARFIRGFDAAKMNPRVFGSPGWYPMVTAFQRGTSGLYLAAHDPDMRIKSLQYLKDGSCHFETPVENAGLVDKAAEGPRYPVVLAAYSGDWWSAARLYRRWALRQKWAAKGPIVKRTDYPRVMSETAIWGRLTGLTAQTTNLLENIRRTWPDVKVGFRWYCWNVQPFDTHYPEFFPLPGVRELCAKARKEGYLVMPYVNGRIWDTGLMSFKYAQRDCCMGADGRPVLENYGRSFGVMCPYASDWQRTLLDAGTDVVEGLGANAIYYDQISCSRPQLCFNPAHGHPLGGGSWWSDGYRRALVPIHDRFSKAGVPVTSEGAAEAWMDLVDGHLIVGRNGVSDDVPFLPAVYAGYTTFFCIEEQAFDSPDAFFARQVQGVLQGCVTGSWSHNRLFDGGQGRSSLSAQSATLLGLARLRTTYADYLAYGTLEDELRPLQALSSVSFEYEPTRRKRKNEKTSISYPVVLGTVWRSSDGKSVALFATNVSDAPQTVEIRCPQGLSRQARAEVVPGFPSGSFVRRGERGELTLEPHSVCVIR